MRKYVLLIICLLLIPSYIYATDGVNTVEHPAKVNSVATPDKISEVSGLAAGAACSTPDNGDELDEGFLGAGYENSWTETGSGTDDENATLTGTPPTGSCTEGLNFISSGSKDVTRWDKGSVFDRSGDLDLTIHLRISSVTISTYSDVNLLHWDNDSDDGTEGLGMIELHQHAAGVYTLRADGSNESIGVSISLATWYIVTLHLDGTAASSYIDVNDVNDDDVGQQSFTRNDAADGRYLHLTTRSIGAGESINVEIGYVFINSP